MPSGPRIFDPSSAIAVRGARVHNLRGIDLDIPRDRLVVLTGVSGSGKSSLAFDTLFAEGQRRYIECLSSYARQFLDQLERPDVDLIEGLPPTVAIDQKVGQASPRSTVGTLTETYDFLRLLFARLGTPFCHGCGRTVDRQTPEQMVDRVLSIPTGRKVLILAPLVRGRKGQHLDVFQAIRRAGLIRARVDGQIVEVTDEPPKLAKNKLHHVEAVVDRLVIREGIRPRLAESIDHALKLTEGLILISSEITGGWEDQLLSIHLSCPDCGISLQTPEPRGFSFNSPYGACPACEGLGIIASFRADLVVPDRTKSIEENAIAPWSILPVRTRQSLREAPALADFFRRHKIAERVPPEAWPSGTLDAMLRGEPDQGFPGVLAELEKLYSGSASTSLRSALDAFREQAPCPACQGSRLRPEARAIRLHGKSIDQVTSLTTDELKRFLAAIRFDGAQEPVARPLIREIAGRLEFLDEVGLGYLTLGRGSDTLSGGELQRARLATQLGAGLVGVCYVLDEPTAGLHPRDTAQLLASLRRLQAQGNSVIVVEHDESIIRAADWVVDLGPGAGPDGGQIVDQGRPEKLAQSKVSLTARYLNRPTAAIAGKSARLKAAPGWISIRGATGHNLKNVDARFPFGSLTCVTGVSGSGKSTLVHDVLARAYRRSQRPGPDAPACAAAIEGLEAFESLIEVDQSPIGRSPRSTPATFTGVFDEIRRVFAKTRQAKVRGYGPSRFSFNARGGRCEACQGQGRRRIPMQLLPDLHVVCDECRGQRFNRQTLEIRFKGKSIGEVLELRVDEALSLFDAQPRVLPGLVALHDVGLGYVSLGQSSTTLSGGEAQRIKLAAQLGRVSTGRSLYMLDEPTTGLHCADVERLLGILGRLADMGNTLLVIEHNLDVIAAADWVVDLGPEAGDAGGNVVAMGPPAMIASVPESRTGAFLRPRLLRAEKPDRRTPRKKPAG